MKRAWLAIAAGIVLIAVIVLLWQLRRTDRAVGQGTSGSATPSAPPAPATGHAAPASPTATDAAPPTGEPRPTNEYLSGDVRVRDHRADPMKVEVPPISAPVGGRKIPRELTHAITAKFRTVLGECAAAIPRADRGKSPRLEGTITVSIADHKVSVTETTVQLRDVTGVWIDSAKQCIEQKSVGLSAAAEDQADLENYPITLSYALP